MNQNIPDFPPNLCGPRNPDVNDLTKEFDEWHKHSSAPMKGTLRIAIIQELEPYGCKEITMEMSLEQLLDERVNAKELLYFAFENLLDKLKQ
jgi:hypothetical protein